MYISSRSGTEWLMSQERSLNLGKLSTLSQLWKFKWFIQCHLAGEAGMERDGGGGGGIVNEGQVPKEKEAQRGPPESVRAWK